MLNNNNNPAAINNSIIVNSSIERVHLYHNATSSIAIQPTKTRAANSKDEFYSAESLFMVLILRQQKTINELISKVAERTKRSSGKLTD
jgi:hypothetical protein